MSDIKAMKRLVAAVEAIPEEVEGWIPDALTDALIDARQAISVAEAEAESLQQEPCGWQFYQDGKWWNGLETCNHRANTAAAGIPVRDVYPAPVSATQERVEKDWRKQPWGFGEKRLHIVEEASHPQPEAEKQEPAIDPCKEGTCDCCWKHLDEQEPVACGLCGEEKAFAGACGGGRDDPRALCYTHPQADQASMTNAWFKKCCELQDELKALQEQEGHGLTIAYMSGFQDGKKAGRKERSDRWVGLTYEEIEGLYESSDLSEFDIQLVRHIEAKLKENNT